MGLWQWREVALAIREAGIPVQSGTIPCERCWAFLRYNYRHYATKHFPGWTDRDSLLSQRIEALAMYAVAMQDELGQPEHLQSFFDPFSGVRAGQG